MCDYSLMGVPNRLAKDGEELVLFDFPTRTKGFASPKDIASSSFGGRGAGIWASLKKLFTNSDLDSVCAVCIAPGSRLMLLDLPVDFQTSVRVERAEEVVFTQLTSATNVHRDAVRFRNGFELSLQRLPDGQRARVISLEPNWEPTPVEEIPVHLR